jgi:hypothetical protein
MVTENLSHLLPEVQELFKLSKYERLAHIKKDIWIGYPTALKALDRLAELFDHPRRQRMPNLMIIGPTNNGKSMIIEKFCRNYKPKIERRRIDYGKFYDLGEQDYLVDMPLISVQMPPVPETRRFYLAILKKFEESHGSAHCSLMNTGTMENTLLSLFRKFNVKMLIIDEIHNILAGPNNKQREFLNVLRFLGNELKIPLVCVGTKDAYLAIRSDPQLENRFEPFLLPKWKFGYEYDSLLASLAAIFPLKRPSNLNTPKISEHILQKSEGILGEIVTLIRRAAIQAYYTQETIDEMMFRMIEYHSPTERRLIFERSLAEVS